MTPRRGGTGDDIARIAVWLLSKEAGYLTGAVLTVRGGMF